ncbi:MAG: hypothetical protein WAO55_02315 [Candidatus Manganitrophaceae bacterium]
MQGQPHTYTYEAQVTGPLPKTLPRFGPDRGVQLGALSEAIDSISKEVGVEMVHPSSAPPDIRFALYILPDPAPGLAGQYYGYLAGITFLVFPVHGKVGYMLVAQVSDGEGKIKTYRYKEAVHVWAHLSLLPVAFFSSYDRAEKKAIRDLALNFFHDFQSDKAFQKQR